jgi:hypothetical protein
LDDWLISHDFLYLLALQIYAGLAWGALEFATMLSFFEGVEERDRTSVLSAFNLANAAAISLGALLGSQLFVLLEAPASAYAWLFAISSVGRLAMLFVLRGARPARRVVEMRLRTLAVRPSAGVAERPILASLNSDAPDAPASRFPGDSCPVEQSIGDDTGE